MLSLQDSTPIKSKKYKTIGELKQSGINSIVQTLARMDKCPERDCLDEWIYNSHYKNMRKDGNLTTRIAHLNNKICYREIMRRCFNNIDILSTKTSTTILSATTIDFIKELHEISSSMLGSFIDYLIRRIISELIGKEFIDNRSETMSTSIRGEWIHECEPTINYNLMSNKQLKNICKEKGVIGYSTMNSEALINCLNRLADKCKFNIYGRISDSNCALPVCQNLSYEKVKNTNDYKTSDIIPDIFITSLFHTEAFGNTPQQSHFDKLYETLKNKENINDILINPLTELCKELIKDKSDILLNPALGGPLEDIAGTIPSDADMVIDDMLIDIKCTKSATNGISEITQLLGYSSLILINKFYNKKINKIAILNILQGSLDYYDIGFIEKNNCIQYIKILTNQD